MIVLKINVIKGYTITKYISAKECNKIEITKGYAIIKRYITIKFFNRPARNRSIRNKF